MRSSLPACLSALSLAHSPLLSPAPRPGPPFPRRLLLLNLFLGEQKARAPDPRAALPKAQVRTQAPPGGGGFPPAAAAARRHRGVRGQLGGHRDRATLGRARRTEPSSRGMSPPARDSFAVDAGRGHVGDGGAAEGVRSRPRSGSRRRRAPVQRPPRPGLPENRPGPAARL